MGGRGHHGPPAAAAWRVLNPAAGRRRLTVVIEPSPSLRKLLRALQQRRADDVPWAPPAKPLAQCRVALVASSVCVVRGDPRDYDGVEIGVPLLREFDGHLDTGELLRSCRGRPGDGAANLERNVALALDGLRAAAGDGRIGELGSRHLALHGPTAATPAELRKVAPEVARRLVDDRVDVALLVPSCPLCSQSMGLAALAIERTGIATVCLQLLHTAVADVRPPRSLWVPFWDGYALGAPDRTEHRSAVLEAAFAMLEDAGATPPAIRDFGSPG